MMSQVRISRWLALGFLTLLSLVTVGWAPPPQEDQFTVTGQVVNGTSGGAVPDDLPITLRISPEMEGAGVHTSSLSAEGAFRFDGLVLEEGQDLMVQVVYQDVEYVSERVVVEPEQSELSLPVTIYETTMDPDVLLVTQMHTFISKVDDRLQIGEYYLVSNTSDRIYVGEENPEVGGRVTLPFSLPAGAENLSFDGSGLGERYLERGGGFVDTEPIPPGTATVETLFSYELFYREGMQIERAFETEVTSVVLLLAAEGIGLAGDDLISTGSLDTQMGPALSYTAGPLSAGDSLVFSVVAESQAMVVSPSMGAVSTAGSGLVRNSARETSVGLVALAAAVVIVYLLWMGATAASIPVQVRPLIEAIVSLEAEFEAGLISEKTYRQKRSSLTRKCRTIMADGR